MHKFLFASTLTRAMFPQRDTVMSYYGIRFPRAYIYDYFLENYLFARQNPKGKRGEGREEKEKNLT